jgi:glyoxylase-like metal-dependent hydrolase (beta-lactamase superfamily II)
MRAQRVTEHVFRVSLKIVNVFLVVLPDAITMVDAGTRRSWPRVAEAIRELDYRPADVEDILITHLHADHTGGLAEAAEATGARVWMHPGDAGLVGAGQARRPVKPSPGNLAGPLLGLMTGITSATVRPVDADGLVEDRLEIPAAGGVLPIWTPGHTAGHVSYLWPGDGGVLFVGDAATHYSRLRPSPIYEDYERGLQSLRELAALRGPGSPGRGDAATLGGAAPLGLAGWADLDFQAACFAHGRPIVGGAAAAFARAWGRA